MSRSSVRTFIRGRAATSWLILIAATLVSFGLGADHGTGSVTALLIFAIAAVKIRLVGLDFMELRSAPTLLRAVFETYCFALWAVLSALYVFA